jgi:DNA-binding NarL/FixJ family response regulator
MVGQTGGDKITVALVEDEPLLRDLLRIALSQHPRLETVGAFGDGTAAVASIPRLRPQVALLDIDLGPGPNGIQVGMLLREQMPDIGIVLLSNQWVPLFATLPQDVVAGWCYLLKRSLSDAATLGRAIEGAASGLVVLDPHLVAARQPREGSSLEKLRPRHREILALIAQGYTNSAIADQLSLSPSTIENQVNQLYLDLGLSQDTRAYNPRVRAALLYLEESQPTAQS